MGLGDSEVPKGLVQEVDDNDAHIRLLTDSISGLQKVSMELRHQVTLGLDEEKLLVVYEQLISMKDQVVELATRTYRGVETLISTKKLNTSLVTPSEVHAELALVKQKVTPQPYLSMNL